MTDTKSFAVDLADGRKIAVDATDEEQAGRLALEQSGGVRAVKITTGKGKADKSDDGKAAKSDDGKGKAAGRATEPPTGEPGETTPAGTPTGPFGATAETETSGGNAGVGGNTVPDGDEELKGEALHERARELDIEGRSGMSADELREAVSEAEAEEGGNDGGKDQ